MNDRDHSVVSSLKSFQKNYHINNPRNHLPVTDSLRPLILGPPDRLSGRRYR